MADTPNPGETVNPEAPSNVPVQTPAATPVANAGDTAEVERLRKEDAKKDLRIRQLENEAKARADAGTEEQRLKLEQDSDINNKLEQERLKREEIERKLEERDEKEALSIKKVEAQKDYPAEILKQAKDLGIDLTGTDEDDVTDYTNKLDKLAENFSSNQSVRGNNGYTPQPDNGVTAKDIREAQGDPDRMADLIRKRNPNGLLAQMITRNGQ